MNKIVKTKSLWMATVCALFVLLSTSVSATEIYYLKNGMPVIIDIDMTKDTTAAVLYVHAGSAAEGDEAGTGIRHFSEHLGAKTYVGALKKLGISANAFTGQEEVGYFFTSPSQEFATAFKYFADDLTEHNVSQRVFENEKKAVLNEISIRKGKPGTYAWELLLRTMFRMSPYGIDSAGDLEMTKKTTPADVEKFFREFYTARNMVLAISGNIDTQRALELASLFEVIANGPTAPQPLIPEPQQGVERTVTEVFPGAQAHLMIGYRAVNEMHADEPALILLASILADGDTSRMGKFLRQSGIPASVSANISSFRQDGLFDISASMPREKVSEIRTAIFKAIEEIALNGVTAFEIEKVLISRMMFYARSEEKVLNRARAKASYFARMGTLNGYSDRILLYKNVTSADIARVAKTYLTASGRTQILLIPKAEKVKKVEIEAIPTVRPVVTKTILTNGIPILIGYDPSLKYSKATVIVRIPDSVRASHPGLIDLATSLLGQGSALNNGEKFADILLRKAISYQVTSGEGFIMLSMDNLTSQNFSEGIALLKEVLSDPLLENKDIIREKDALKEVIRENEYDQSYNLSLHTAHLLYPDHPYAMRVNEAEIEALSASTLDQFYKEQFCSNALIIAVSGGISQTDSAIEQFPFIVPVPTCVNEKWSTDIAPPYLTGGMAEFDMPQPTATITYGFRVMGSANSQIRSLPISSMHDRLVLRLLSSYVSELIEEGARAENGISYSQGAMLRQEEKAGYVYGYVTVNEAKNISVARKIIEEAFLKVRTTAMSDKMFAELVRRYRNRLIMSWESIDSRVQSALAAEILGRDGPNFEAEMTKALSMIVPADLDEFAIKYFTVEQSVTVIQYGKGMR